MATKRFLDSDAPSLLRELLGSLSITVSHAVGPLEYRAGMDRLNRDIVIDGFSNIREVTNDDVLMITGKKLLRTMDAAAGDAFVLVEPRIGPALSLSRLDFRRGNAHLLGLLSAWWVTCAEDLEFARGVTETVCRGILKPGGIIALCGTPKCRVVTDIDITTLLDNRGVVNVVVGPRAVATVATACLGRPLLADMAAKRVANVAILHVKGKFLPVIDDLVNDEIAKRWYLMDREEDDETYGACVVCYEAAELVGRRKALGSLACPICKYGNMGEHPAMK